MIRNKKATSERILYAVTVDMHMKHSGILTTSPFSHPLIKHHCSTTANVNAYMYQNHSSYSPSLYQSIKSYTKVDTGADANANYDIDDNADSAAL